MAQEPYKKQLTICVFLVAIEEPLISVICNFHQHQILLSSIYWSPIVYVNLFFWCRVSFPFVANIIWCVCARDFVFHHFSHLRVNGIVCSGHNTACLHSSVWPPLNLIIPVFLGLLSSCARTAGHHFTSIHLSGSAALSYFSSNITLNINKKGGGGALRVHDPPKNCVRTPTREKYTSSSREQGTGFL